MRYLIVMVLVFSCVTSVFGEVKRVSLGGSGTTNLGWTNLTEPSAVEDNKSSSVGVAVDMNIECNFMSSLFIGVKGDEENRDMVVFKRIKF